MRTNTLEFTVDVVDLVGYVGVAQHMIAEEELAGHDAGSPVDAGQAVNGHRPSLFQVLPDCTLNLVILFSGRTREPGVYRFRDDIWSPVW
mmetsp:Transcript_5691/g.13370  ORF Transcript_5691/g.13370 Transcript_5691/m.13370 type:complete len:90 (+) Transcript_5691:199-468(+)